MYRIDETFGYNVSLWMLNSRVLVKVKLPTRITEDERNLLESLASKYSDKNSSSNSGLFSKFFGKES